MKLKILLVSALFYSNLATAQTLQSVTDNGSSTSNFIKIKGRDNISNGLGLEFYMDSGTGYITNYDRGGTDTFKPLLLRGSNLSFYGDATFYNNVLATTFTGNLIGNATSATTTAAVSGTATYLPRFTSANTIGNSAMSEDNNYMVSTKSFYVTGTNPGIRLEGDNLSYYPSVVFSSQAPHNTGNNSIMGYLGLLSVAAPGGSIRFATGTAAENRLVIEDNGTVHISKNLNVSATVRSKEVKVDMNGWSDFVFDKNYGLISLPELEKYIQLHKHLPEIPSAVEVETNGLNLGDINKKLLQKIEELTLHLIQKDKEIKTNTEKLTELDLKVNKLLTSKTEKTN